jgi:tetratricopeptide (TPR) repeat protein
MAIVRYDQALEKDPRSADAWAGKGVALQYQEKYREALAAYDTALALRPGHDLATKWRETVRKRLEAGG